MEEESKLNSLLMSVFTVRIDFSMSDLNPNHFLSKMSPIVLSMLKKMKR